jgi:hypothetical protein
MPITWRDAEPDDPIFSIGPPVRVRRGPQRRGGCPPGVRGLDAARAGSDGACRPAGQRRAGHVLIGWATPSYSLDHPGLTPFR